MAKTFFKKLVAFLVIGLTLVPMSLVRAASTSSDTVIDNMAKATSADIDVNLDLTMKTDAYAEPITAHFGVDGASDSSTQQGAFDYSYWSTDYDGTFQKHNGSVVLDSDTVYLQQDGGSWYYAKTGTSSGVPSNTDIQETTDELKSFLKDMFDEGIIEYHVETADVINGTMTTRYAYAIDNTALLAYFEEKGYITAEQAEASSFETDTVISGNFWIDTTEMLPVMFTMNVANTQSATSYTNVSLSVLFKSFNEPVSVTIPTNAIDFASANWDTSSIDSVASTVAAATSTDDADADGLSDTDEATVWYTNPYSADTDWDGYADNTEVINGYNPNGTGKLDSDGDGLTDYAELTIHWTDRFDTDSDNDGYSDGTEIANGYNPNGTGRW